MNTEHDIIGMDLPEREWRLLRAQQRKARNDALVESDEPLPSSPSSLPATACCTTRLAWQHVLDLGLDTALLARLTALATAHAIAITLRRPRIPVR